MIHSTTLELKLRSHQSRIGMRFAGGHGTTEELVPEDWVPAVLSALKELESDNARLREALKNLVNKIYGTTTSMAVDRAVTDAMEALEPSE